MFLKQITTFSLFQRKELYRIASILVILLAGVAVSSLVAIFAQRIDDNNAAGRFQTGAHNLADVIDRRFNLYQYGLRGARGAIISMGLDLLSRDRFHNYSATRDLEKEFPGALAFGFIQRVRHENEAAFLDHAKADGAPWFAIRHLSSNPGEEFIIKYVEPAISNQAAIGLDVASDPVRKQAALTSAKTGTAAITGPITLVQAEAAAKHGFLIMLPVYDPAETTPKPAHPEEAAYGWTYAPIVSDDVMASITPDFQDFDFTLADVTTGDSVTFFKTLAEPQPAAIKLQTSISLHLLNRTWLVTVTARHSFIKKLGFVPPELLGAIIFLIFIALAVAQWVYLLARRRAQLLAAEQRRLAAIVQGSSDAIISGDIHHRVQTWNAGAERLFGYSAAEAIGRPICELIYPAGDPAGTSEVWHKIARGETTPAAEVIRKHKDGHLIPVLRTLSAIYEENGNVTGTAAIMRDVSAQKAAEDEILRLNESLKKQIAERTSQLEASRALQTAIQHLALHDSLTGLPNRTMFQDRLREAIAQARNAQNGFAVLICDLDRFKSVNDTYGHPAGDELLCEVARRMRAAVAPAGIVTRLGGDEFAIILYNCNTRDTAAAAAGRLIASVCDPIDADGVRMEIGMSIGFALHAAGAPDSDPDDIFKNADIALYEAKASGRNTFRAFEAGVQVRALQDNHLVLDMRESIRRGDFTLVYQPVVNGTTSEVRSFEALMRWNHPTYGELPPGRFIQLAEDTGLIIPLGLWALQTACWEAAAWPDHIRVSVNVSAVQLNQKEWETSVADVLAQTGLAPGRLIIEVTESVLIQKPDDVIARLRRLREMGVTVALDDFGTGFSSLSSLQRLCPDKIKIDRAFIQDIANPDTAAIVRAIVSIGLQLGLEITAEGVETKSQHAAALGAGCTEIQGFLFSRPLPPGQALAYACKTLPMVA